MLLFMSILFLTPSNAYAATVGQALTRPEDGWQRFDDTDSKIIYSGTWLDGSVNSTASKLWNGTASMCWGGNAETQPTVTFKFYGTKIRLISESAFNRSIDNIVIIDGKAENFSSYNSSAGVYQSLVYENTDLALAVHTVVIKPSTSMTSSQCLYFDAIDINDIGYLISYYQPQNVFATSGNEKVTLKWDEVPEASGYVIHYGTSSGNLTETKTVTGGAVTTTDIEGLLNGTKYYFTVTAIINDVENTPSIEVTATPTDDSVPTDHVGNSAALELTMTNGGIKVYNLPITHLDNFLTWYDNRSNEKGRAYYTFTKTTSIAPYLSMKEYVSFDKISSFEVKEYNQ
jgi:hypothetical protein